MNIEKGELGGEKEPTEEKSKTFMHRETPAVANSSSSRSNSILQQGE